jgi:ADP-dependent NAD(P)H-hydrate dehydratase / NAD(P)H-hydrate epimerase
MRLIEAAHADWPLMERAGTAASLIAAQLAQGSLPVLVLAGPGNNGGDAFVLARKLHESGRAVTVVFPGDAARLPPDAHAALERWQLTGQATHTELPQDDYGLIVDGLFGIGLRRPIEGNYHALIEHINAYRASGGPVLALDVPSGLDADTGRLHGIAVNASHTATFIADKPGLHTLHGPCHAGTITVHELGIGPTEHAGELLAKSEFAHCLRTRENHAHKGSHGSLALIGGDTGMCGAALLAARAALHLGAGRLFVGLLDPARPALDYAQPELMLRTPEAALAHATALVAGPGMGLTDIALALIRRITSADLPIILDADALTLIAQHPDLVQQLRQRHHPTLLTPHPAEAARLLNISTDDVQTDRIAAATQIAQKFNALVVLKGNGSILAHPDGRWRINATGNPGLATGGTGDVLAGMIGALIAQHWPRGKPCAPPSPCTALPQTPSLPAASAPLASPPASYLSPLATCSTTGRIPHDKLRWHTRTNAT